MKSAILGACCAALLAGSALAQNAPFKYPSWMWEEGQVGAWHKERKAEFEAKRPGLKVEATVLSPANFENVITTQIAAGDVPDLMPVYTNMLAPLIREGVLAPLDDCIAASSFKDRLLPSVKYAQKDGKTYGIPLTMSPQSMIVNRDLLEKAGVERIPTTPDEFYAAAKAVKEKTGQWGYGFPNNMSNALFPYLQSMQWIVGLGGDWSKPDGTITANSPLTIQGVTWIKRFLDEKLSPRGLDANAIRTMFAEGKVAFIFDGPWVIVQVGSANPELAKKVDFTVMPTPTHAAITGGAYYTIPAGSKRKAEACQYLDIINAEPAQRAYVEKLLQIPGTDVKLSPEFLAGNPWVGKMVEIAAKYPGGLGYAPPGYAVDAAEFRQIAADHLAKIYAGTATVEEGLNQAQKALETWSKTR
ncbi:ABC transporter substrate-binding protein [Bosea sp. UC22_33]|uniref:ABC transporter substrate-binding protein n=1 Tax=Bosea sp. UC22_33 TaxID=3350165 RepID=UPI003671CCC8